MLYVSWSKNVVSPKVLPKGSNMCLSRPLISCQFSGSTWHQLPVSSSASFMSWSHWKLQRAKPRQGETTENVKKGKGWKGNCGLWDFKMWQFLKWPGDAVVPREINLGDENRKETQESDYYECQESNYYQCWDCEGDTWKGLLGCESSISWTVWWLQVCFTFIIIH